MLKESFFNMALRAVFIVSKFAAIFGIARLLNPSELGVYFWFVTIAATYSAVAGFQMFHVVMREYNHSAEKSYFLNQYVLVAVVIFTTFVFWPEALLDSYGQLHTLLLLCLNETLSIEINRYYIALGRTIKANAAAALNSFSYVIFAASVYALDADDVEAIFDTWAIVLVVFVLVNLTTGFYSLRANGLLFYSWLSIKKMKYVILSSIPYFVSQLFNILNMYSGRFYIKGMLGLDALAAYSLIFSIGNVLFMFLSAGLIAPYSARILQNEFMADIQFGLLKRLVLQLGLFSVVAIFLLLLSFDYLLVILDKEEFLVFKVGFVFILIGVLLLAISQSFQLIFLSKRKDMFNLWSYGVVSVGSLIFYPLALNWAGLSAAFFVFFMSALLLFSIRLCFFVYLYQCSRSEQPVTENCG